MQDNSEMERLRAFINYTDTNIFLTGRAGTGKTTLLHSIVNNCPKPLIVVAPTGIAAINAHGVTIHSFFQLPFSVFNPAAALEAQKLSKAKLRIIRSLELLIIDEVSMVRCDLLDAIDASLRRHRHSSKPFGGVQLLLIGDMQQLPPVVRADEWTLMQNHYNSQFFFDSLALKKAGYLTLELSQIFRQTDREFIDILGRVRSGNVDAKTLAALNARYDPNGAAIDEYTITLCSHNHIADGINASRMAAIDEPEYMYSAIIADKFNAPDPVDRELCLKLGARVMFARNDSSSDKRYVNGTLAQITAIDEESIEVVMDGQSEPYSLHTETWDTVHYDIDAQTKQYTTVIDGTFTQYPLRTAWAVTIHKSQGLTFDNVALDASDSFDHGQVYVALSRCRTLQGIRLLRPLNARAIFTSSKIEAFNTECQDRLASSDALAANAENYRRQLIVSIFNFDDILSPLRGVQSAMNEHILALYPQIVTQWNDAAAQFTKDVIAVAEKFKLHINYLFNLGTENNSELQERIKKGARYFADTITSTVHAAFLASTADDIEVDSRENRKIINNRLEALYSPLNIHLAVMEWCAENGFSTLDVITVRSKAALDEIELKQKRKKSVKTTSVDPSESALERMTKILREWRREKSAQMHRPAYMILTQSGLLGIAETLPGTIEELAQIKGIGKVFLQKYGIEILSVIKGEK